VGQWLTTLQGDADGRSWVEHTPLADVQRWAGRSGTSLFDTLFVFENFPISAEARERDVGLRIESSARADRTHYPLKLAIQAEPTLELNWEWDDARGDFVMTESIAR